jgi:hypothetical protein
MTALAQPPSWTEAELEEAGLEAVELFRRERLGEPLEDYFAYFDLRVSRSRVRVRPGDVSNRSDY